MPLYDYCCPRGTSSSRCARRTPACRVRPPPLLSCGTEYQRSSNFTMKPTMAVRFYTGFRTPFFSGVISDESHLPPALARTLIVDHTGLTNRPRLARRRAAMSTARSVKASQEPGRCLMQEIMAARNALPPTTWETGAGRRFCSRPIQAGRYLAAGMLWLQRAR